MIEQGQKAPEFSLEDQDGRVVRLADLKGNTVVLYFYPKDDTPGCTTEACSFRDAFADIKARGAFLFGISADTTESHTKFREKYDLPFPLLSDKDASVARSYGVWGKKKMFGKTHEGIQRSTFVIGPDGVVQKVFPKVKPEEHAGEVLAAL
ncbi:MAG: thioredoxin-dependent thiol peroxidase [Spirochaetia bacterium]